MKPIVIYPNDSGKHITLTKEEFEKYLKEAYDTGYSDGYAAAPRYNWWNTPITYPTTNPIQWTNTTPDITPDYTKITCDAHNDIGG